jgi:hypothetical protein
MPAYCLVFEQYPDIRVSGDNLGDVVNINLLNIFKENCINPFSDSEFKGYLLYVLFHELIHLDQDLCYYYDRYKKEPVAAEKLEDACHAVTFLTLLNYCKTMEQNKRGYFEIPSISSFVHPRKTYQMEKEGRKQELYNYITDLSNKFVRIQHPIQKVLWLIAHGIYGQNYRTFYEVCSQYMNVKLEVFVNGYLYTSGDIKVLGQFVNWKMIMDLYRLVILFSKQLKTDKVYCKDNIMDTHIENIHVEFLEGAKDKSFAKYVYTIDGVLDIAYKN